MEAQESTLAGLLRVISLGARGPISAIRFVLDSPGEAKRFVHRNLTQTKFSDDKYVERSFGQGNLTVHLMNHLAYTSTLDGSPIRVDRPVEDAMIERRVYNDGFYVPSPTDELAHLICRGVYDYHGSFPPHYVSRCNVLRNEVLDDDEMNDQFRELLAWLFFEADELVYELVRERAYDSIRKRLRRFSDY